MPVINGPSSPTTPTVCQGMTRSDIIELANELTERKGERVLNLPLLFSHVLQDFCGRSRYWWRNYYATFSTVAGQQDYDLTDSSVFTPDLTEIAAEEITEVALISAGVVTYLEPVFDPRTIIEMRQGFNQSGTAVAGVPSRYTMDANSFNQLFLDQPDKVYSMAVTFWAMPNKKVDSVSDCVPLVPTQHHKAIVAGMEQKIWKRVEGIGSKQYLAAKQEYEDAIMLAQARQRFTSKYSQQLIPSDGAIRST